MRDRNSSTDFADTTSSVRLFWSETVLMKNRHHVFCEVVPVRNSSDEEAVSVDVCF